jgi:hypothetical protein
MVRAEEEYLASLRILGENEATQASAGDEPEDSNHPTASGIQIQTLIMTTMEQIHDELTQRNSEVRSD